MRLKNSNKNKKNIARLLLETKRWLYFSNYKIFAHHWFAPCVTNKCDGYALCNESYNRPRIKEDFSSNRNLILILILNLMVIVVCFVGEYEISIAFWMCFSQFQFIKTNVLLLDVCCIQEHRYVKQQRHNYTRICNKY